MLCEKSPLKKRGNEEQFKHNNKVLMKLQEAETSMSGAISDEKIVTCRTKISEGMTLIKHRQKLIKLADSTDSGWRLVQEYESNPLASDSEDEKRIFKAQTRGRTQNKSRKGKTKRNDKALSSIQCWGPERRENPDSSFDRTKVSEARALFQLRGQGALEKGVHRGTSR